MGYVAGSRSRAISAVGAIVLGAVLTIGVFAGPAGAADGSIKACVDLGYDAKEFTIDLRAGVLVEAVYGDSETGFEVEVANVVQHGHGMLTFDLSSNQAIHAVFGTTHLENLPSPWDLPSTVAGLLTAKPAPGASLSGQVWASVQLWASFGRSVHRITFCWDNGHDTPIPSQPTTTTSTSTTTTQPGTSTSSTTSLEQPIPTTTESLPSAGPATTVPSTTTSRDGDLPRTGSSTAPLLTIGGVLLLGGSILLASTRLLNRYRA